MASSREPRSISMCARRNDPSLTQSRRQLVVEPYSLIFRGYVCGHPLTRIRQAISRDPSLSSRLSFSLVVHGSRNANCGIEAALRFDTERQAQSSLRPFSLCISWTNVKHARALLVCVLQVARTYMHLTIDDAPNDRGRAHRGQQRERSNDAI